MPFFTAVRQADNCQRYGKKVRRKLRPKTGEREVVEKIFQLSLYGDGEIGPCGIVKIAEWLDLNEIRTRGGSKFGTEAVHLILTNSSYTGKYRWNYEAIEREFVEGDEDKEVFEFDLEPIIDKETFERVQLKMASQAPNKRTDTWVYRGSLLLRELAHCTCGGRLGLATGTGRDGEARRYYLCNRKKRVGKHECSASRVNEVVLDEIVLGAIKETLLDDQRLGALLRAWTEKEAVQYAMRVEAGASVQAKADRADRELRSMINLAKADPDLAGDEVFMKEMSAARRAAVAARNDLAALGMRGTAPDQITPEQVAIFGSMMRGMLEGGNRDEIKAYLRSIISRIEVGESQIRILGDHDTLIGLVGGNAPMRVDEEDGQQEIEVRNSMGKWCTRQDSNL